LGAVSGVWKTLVILNCFNWRCQNANIKSKVEI
jgi:hypothetical protein